jgi:hypothetical protein
MVAGAVRRWLLERDELPERSLVAVCPITVRDRERDAGNDQHGNVLVRRRVGFGYAAGADVVPDVRLIPLTEECLAELEASVGSPSG